MSRKATITATTEVTDPGAWRNEDVPSKVTFVVFDTGEFATPEDGNDFEVGQEVNVTIGRQLGEVCIAGD